MPCVNTKYCLRVVVDFTFLCCVGTAIFLVKKLWPPFKRGMRCYDVSLTLPYKDYDTISDTLLLFYGVAIPLNVMCLVEFLRARKEIIGKEFRLCGRRVSSWLWAIYGSAGLFLFGCACTQLFTDVAKYSLGYLRPHFIEVCQPDWAKTNCSTNRLDFVDPIPCTTDDMDKLKDARLSFPSGHASFSTFTMIYLVVYLQARFTLTGFKLVRPLIQLVCLLLALYTCFTRISDYKHHWSDVVGGFLLGGSIAIFLTFFVSDLFVERASRETKNDIVRLQEYQTPTEQTHANAHNP